MTNFVSCLVTTIALLYASQVDAFPEKWHKKNLTIRMCADFMKNKKQVRKAARMWEKVTGVKFHILSSHYETAGDISICYVYRPTDMKSVDASVWAETTTTRTSDDKKILRAVIRFNQFKYDWKNMRKIFKKVLLHELGHALGFGHRKTYYSVMNMHAPHHRILKKDKQIARKKYKHFVKRQYKRKSSAIQVSKNTHAEVVAEAEAVAEGLR